MRFIGMMSAMGIYTMIRLYCLRSLILFHMVVTVMTLDQEDITAMATEVVRQLDIRAIAQELHRLLRGMDDMQMDVAHYIRTVPIEERKRRAREQMRRERDAEKAHSQPSKVPPLEKGRHDPKRLLKEAEASEILATPAKTLEDWRVKGKGPKYVKLGRAVRYRLSDIEEFIKGLGSE